MVKGMAGIRSFATLTPSPQRAAIQSGGDLFAVAGDTFYRLDSAGIATALGNVTGTGSVDIGTNTSQIAILIEPDLWVFDGSNLTQVTDTDFTSRGAKKMAVLDNYGGFIEPNSGRFFISDLTDFSVYDPLDFATAESAPDNLLSIEALTEFALFGEETIELWENVGGSDFPFERIANGVINCGCGAANATCTADNTYYWIDQDRLARRLEGNVPRRISHEGVEERWQDYSTIADALAFSYVYDGHTFVVFTFPTAGATWVYDINTQEWHERQSYGHDHWRAQWVVKCYGKTLVGDTQSGNIGEIHATTYSEWGEVLSREATTGVTYAENNWMFCRRLEVDMEVGQGTETGQGSNPVMMIEVSDDGGVNFRALPSKSIGTTGQTRKRVHWDGMGRTRERVHRFRVTDPVPFIINAARLDVES